MFKLNLLRVLLVFGILSMLAACKKKEGEGTGDAQKMPPTMGQQMATGVQPCGISWTTPSHWTVMPPKTMRIASYGIPAPTGDGEMGECGVFYFGGGQGGTGQDNINRWIGQFDQGGKHAISSKEVNGMKVSIIQIDGAYLSPSGPMMQSQGKKEHFRLLGAIIEGPRGLVFFKCTGPLNTMTAAQSDFDALVSSCVSSPA